MAEPRILRFGDGPGVEYQLFARKIDSAGLTNAAIPLCLGQEPPDELRVLRTNTPQKLPAY